MSQCFVWMIGRIKFEFKNPSNFLPMVMGKNLYVADSAKTGLICTYKFMTLKTCNFAHGYICT